MQSWWERKTVQPLWGQHRGSSENRTELPHHPATPHPGTNPSLGESSAPTPMAAVFPTAETWGQPVSTEGRVAKHKAVA